LAANNLKQRLITAFALLPVVVLATWFDKPIPWLTLGGAIWGAFSLFEFFKLVKNHDQRVKPLTVAGIIWVAALIAGPHFSDYISQSVIFTVGVIASLIWYLFKQQKDAAFLSWAWTIAGVIYTGLLLSYLVSLRLLPDGAGWVFLALFATFASDTAAFFTGSLLGRTRLAPSISPSKTWEGAFGGLVGGMAMSPLVVFLFNLPVSWPEAIIIGALISIFGQFGDLVESLFKRNMSAKDSGKTVPGHGGCLDRMDSVVFAVVVVYYYVVWLV
jgi:phosphatidate cytidylyltransferase